MAFALAVLSVSFWGGGLVLAQYEIPLQNDSFQDGDTARIQLGFVDGEIGAATFPTQASLFPIEVLRVQIFWQSYFGSQPDSLQHSIRVYTGGVPNPTLVDFLEGPVLVDGFLNEFDLDPFDILINSPVSKITVGLQFDDAPDGNVTKPSLITDDYGCDSGRNAVYAIPGGWMDLCGFGAQGNFVMRAVILATNPPFQIGDMNCNGNVNNGDIPPFLLALTDRPAYEAAFPSCPLDFVGDCNQDGSVNNADIPAFVELLTGK